MVEEAATQKTDKEAKKEKVINCASCNKPRKRIKRYYRNGKYYCSKKCYKKSKTKKAT